MGTGTDAWFEGKTDTAREAWNRVKPASGFTMMLLFVACWVIVVAITWLIPYTRSIIDGIGMTGHADDSASYRFEFLILIIVTFALAQTMARMVVAWHRGHMPDDLVGVQTVLFEPHGYEIVGGGDHYLDSDDDSMVADRVQTLLFRPTQWDYRIDVLAYPAGSEVGQRESAEEIMLLISGNRVRLEGPAVGESLNPRPKYRSDAMYLLVEDEATSSSR